MRLTLTLLVLFAALLSGCSRSPNLSRTYYQLNVSEAVLDQHLQELQGTKGVRQVTHAHDSSNKVTLQVYVDSENPFDAQELLRSLGYTRVRD